MEDRASRYLPVNIVVIVSHRYDAHGRLITVPSRPPEVTLAFVVVAAVDDTYTMSAAVASAHGDALRPHMVVYVRYKIVVTNATIRADAIAVLTTPFANRLAQALVPRRETVVARAPIRRRARAIGACWDAERYAITVRVLCVTVIANANA